jgi:pyruvate/2-oxoglutarate dehydrogenase complex dihydrolipoamide acyltransferase (E2) component
VSSSRTDGAGSSAALVEVTMPQMGVSVAEGTIVAWRKQVGDRVERDETICEISTDKVDSEIPSPASGRVARILVEVNETVPVGTPLAELDTGAGGEEPGGRARANGGEPARAESASGHAPGGSNGSGEPDRSHVISPVVQRIASEHGVDLSKVKGTGVGGRIRKKDLLRHLETEGAPAEPVLHGDSPYRPDEAPPAPEAEQPPPVPAAAEGRREPLSPMRRQIAEHMLRSRRTAAHCTTVIEVDMSRVAARRGELKPQLAARGVPLTYLAFVARATVAALGEHPVLNVSLEGEELVYHDDVNLGIAVALEHGLIVPVIRQAQRLSLEGLAAAIGELSERARAKRLEPDDVTAGTFTITNPGQFGTSLATPIINQPQVAILDLEAVIKRPVVVEGPDGDSIAIRPTTNLCLSFDHRALDGAEAARFLRFVKDRLEGWSGDG